MKTKTKAKKVVVNYIPLETISFLKNQSDCFASFMSKLGLNNLANSKKDQLTLFFIYRGIIYSMFGYNPHQVFDSSMLKTLISTVLSEFYNFRKDGYVNQGNLESNKIFRVFRSIYPFYRDVFNTTECFRPTMLFELEHFHNLVILFLLFDIELTLKKMKDSSDVCMDDSQKESVFSLTNERSLLQKTLSGGIRVSLSKNRVILLKKLYVGFDTEFKNLDSQTNKLLCYTTASLCECILKIRSNDIDFSVHDGKVFQPRTSALLEIGVGLIRLYRNKKDTEVSRLVEELQTDRSLECLKLGNNDLIFKLKSFDFTKIRELYTDLSTDPQEYSFKKLMDSVLESSDTLPSTLILFLEKTGRYNIKPTLKQECTLLAHFTTADVSLFHDFEEVKTKFTVISKSFLTLDKFLTYRKWRVFLRDTALLSPGGMSLKSIGNLYPSLPLSKIELTSDYYKNMDVFQRENPVLFQAYAKQDAKIVLWHALEVQNSHYKFTGKYTIPITLSSLASLYLENELIWKGTGQYHPKTGNGLISLRSIPKMMTPAGVELSGDLHEYLDYFLGSYHGGRNESYLYGVVQGTFYDYDLPGAYPTAMSLLDYPVWDKKQMIQPQNGKTLLYALGEERLLRSYTALKIKFVFPSCVQYPNLPVRLDFSSIIFPLSGETFCTGLEFLLAMRLNCEIVVLGGVHIPFQNSLSVQQDKKPVRDLKQEIPVVDPRITDLYTSYHQAWEYKEPESFNPQLNTNFLYLKNVLEKQTGLEKPLDIPIETQFFTVVQEVLKERLKYPKGSYMNLLYKFIANAGIGQMARGLNQKPKYDSHTNSTRIQPAGALINPLYAGWITSFIRSTLSELMNKHDSSVIISCTTDGFISDKKDLDKTIPDKIDLFSSLYYDTRAKLTGSGALLETKYIEPKGVISWRTRGQLGLSGGIKALTGYQRHEPIEQTIDKVNKSFNGSKQIAFIQTSLRSAKEIYQGQGHCTLKINERFFNLRYDNRREITQECKGYHQTKPFKDKTHSVQSRLIAGFGGIRYRVYSPISSSQTRGDAYLSLTRRMIVRLLRTDSFLINHPYLSRLDIALILKKIGLRTSLNFISKQKNLSVILNSIPPTPKTLECLKNLQVLFPSFDYKILIR